ncbi:MAG TPA: tetratricopeptide repeat protein [Terriglobales bacterium]|nr:tetratricopeptide repeat protein [Terriglobales bacterium]
MPSAPVGMGQDVTPEQLKHMAEKQAEPLIASLKASPKDPQLLARIGNIYYDTQQYKTAIDYYSKALQVRPDDPNIRTDMATAYWYLRDVDRALAEFDKSLTYSPTHPGTLLNKGVVLWQGRNDTKGAVASWQKLLDTNPGFPDRQKIVELIARAKEHTGRGGAPRS